MKQECQSLREQNAELRSSVSALTSAGSGQTFTSAEMQLALEKAEAAQSYYKEAQGQVVTLTEEVANITLKLADQRAAKSPKLASEEEAHQALHLKHASLMEHCHQLEKLANSDVHSQHLELQDKERRLCEAEVHINESHRLAETELMAYKQAQAQLLQAHAETVQL